MYISLYAMYAHIYIYIYIYIHTLHFVIDGVHFSGVAFWRKPMLITVEVRWYYFPSRLVLTTVEVRWCAFVVLC